MDEELLAVAIVALLVIWFALPLLTSAANLLTSLATKRRIHPIILFVLTLLAGCATFYASLKLSEYASYVELQQYDLNGDGVVDKSEATDEYEAALDEWANDADETLAPVIISALTSGWYSIVFATIWIPVEFIRIFNANSPKSGVSNRH